MVISSYTSTATALMLQNLITSDSAHGVAMCSVELILIMVCNKNEPLATKLPHCGMKLTNRYKFLSQEQHEH